MRDEKTMDKEILARSDIQKVIAAISSIQYGSVTVIVQDGKIVQIEKNEKEKIR